MSVLNVARAIKSYTEFRKLLPDARGVTRFGIVVSYDIRGFSAASARLDASQVGLLVKTVYQIAVEDWYSGAAFFKPAGDGGIAIFTYADESELESAAGNVVECSWRAAKEYSERLADDRMLDYPVPTRMGIGIARGPLCELRSKNRVLDYCGSAMNLACRLTDLARPSGVVIDGRFGIELVPNGIRKELYEMQAYLPGLAESLPATVLLDPKQTQIPRAYSRPLSSQNWQTITHTLRLGELRSFNAPLAMVLPSTPASESDIRLRIRYPTVVADELKEGYFSELPFGGFSVERGQPEVRLIIAAGIVVKHLTDLGVEDLHKIEIRVSYLEDG